MSSLFDWLFGDPEPSNYERLVAGEDRKRRQALQDALDGPYGDNATLYERTADLVTAANFPEPVVFAARVMLRFLERCDALHIPPPHDDIVIQMAGTAAGLYADERFKDLPPNPALYGTHAYNTVLGRIRDLLLRQQIKALRPTATLDALSSAIVESGSRLRATCRRYPRLPRRPFRSLTCFPILALLFRMPSNRLLLLLPKNLASSAAFARTSRPIATVSPSVRDLDAQFLPPNTRVRPQRPSTRT